MKKVLPYILIVLIFVQLFAPFTVGRGIKNNLEIQNNKVEAEQTGIILTTIPEKNDESIKMNVKVEWFKQYWGGFREGVQVTLFDDSGQKISSEVVSLTDSELNGDHQIQRGEVIFSGLKPETNYVVETIARQVTNINADWVIGISWDFKSLWGRTPEQVAQAISEDTLSETINNDQVKTLAVGNTTLLSQQAQTTATDNALMPACKLLEASTWSGCFGRVLYYLIFVPTSFLFSKTGLLLDFTVSYSLQDQSYRSTFVVEGWGVVRDFCNMFFIFILLYIAIGTILRLNGVKTKEMIINVVIIGLLINFSLFATQIIIDASNILARVFYNQQTIVIGTKDPATGKIIGETGSFGEIKLSEAIVSKINPQQLILKAGKVDKIPVQGINNSNQQTSTGISAGTFILVTIMGSIINIVGLIVFLACSLIFITRVIGLWLAMIFAPLAFFSYAAPGMQDLEMVGWKKWWPETLKLAFLAPVFVFFLYLIVKFLDTGLGLSSADEKSKMDFVLGIFIPFIFIMVLLWKAKDIAKNMSGKLGQSITNGLAAVGGIALGGAALGTAMLGRGVGNVMGKAAGGETSSQKYAAAKKLDLANGNTKAMDSLSRWQKTKGATGNFFGMHKIYGKNEGKVDPTTKIPIGISTGLGGLLNKAQKKSNKVDRARDITDSDIEKAGFKGMKWSNMSDEQKEIVREKVRIENYTKWMDEAEKEYRDKNNLNKMSKDGKLQDLTSDEKLGVKNLAKSKAVGKFEDQIETATKGVNAFVRAFSKANTGTWDVRNLSNVSSDKRANVFTKIPVGLMAAVATGVRGGILKSSGLSHGTVKIEGKFLSDLKSTLSDSLKNIKVELPETHGSENAKKVGHGSGH